MNASSTKNLNHPNNPNDSNLPPISIETSARHVHLSRADLDKLFGEGYELTLARSLSQPGTFLAEERLTLVGKKGQFEHVAILAPLREQTQVEVSLTDARALGVAPPIRESGDLAGSAQLQLVSPSGKTVDLAEGVIVAKRHIHMSPADAQNFGVSHGDLVSVKVDSESRSLTFSDVVIRVSSNFRLAMHVDTDEANAANLSSGSTGTLIK